MREKKYKKRNQKNKKNKSFENKKDLKKHEEEKIKKIEEKEEKELRYLKKVLKDYEFNFQEILQLLEWSPKKRVHYLLKNKGLIEKVEKRAKDIINLKMLKKEIQKNEINVRKIYKTLLNHWEEKGEIFLKRNGKYTLPEKEGFLRGEISIGNGNFGFLDILGEHSVFIPGAYLNTAMNGDTVLVRILKESSSSKKREGEVVNVIKTERL